MQIVYKKGLHNAYAKEVSGEVKLIIPYALKNDENFLEKMQLLWMKLQQKINNNKKSDFFFWVSFVIRRENSFGRADSFWFRKRARSLFPARAFWLCFSYSTRLFWNALISSGSFDD